MRPRRAWLVWAAKPQQESAISNMHTEPVQRWRSDLSTLEELYDAYHRQALGLAYRLLGDRPTAEDVVQEAYLAAWRSLDTFDSTRGSIRTWLLTIVRNRALDVCRTRRLQPPPGGAPRTCSQWANLDRAKFSAK